MRKRVLPQTLLARFELTTLWLEVTRAIQLRHRSRKLHHKFGEVGVWSQDFSHAKRTLYQLSYIPIWKRIANQSSFHHPITRTDSTTGVFVRIKLGPQQQLSPRGPYPIHIQDTCSYQKFLSEFNVTIFIQNQNQNGHQYHFPCVMITFQIL